MALASLACAKGASPPPPDGGTLNPPAPTWARGYQASLFARALGVSCAPPDAQAGVTGCIALIRYRGSLSGVDVPGSGDDSYGSIVFVRTDATGMIVWTKTLMSGFDPISLQTGAFVDDDLRVQLLATGEFLVSGTYEGRVFIGTPGGNNQEFGPSTNRNLMMIEFHSDGTFDNWEDTGNGMELHALGVVELASTQLVIAGSCQGDVPLDNGSFNCGPSTDGYLLTINYDGSTVGGVSFGGTRPAQASDIVTDSASNLYVSGSFSESMTVGTNPPDLSSGEDDGFLMKLLPNGTRAWIVAAAGLGRDRGGRLARVPGGTLWTASVSLGARIGSTIFPEATQAVSKIDDSGAVVWSHAIPHALTGTPLGIAAADDGSFTLYGDGFLGRYDATGTERWESLNLEVRGASFTSQSLVVVANVVGSNVLGASIASTMDDLLRGALVALPR